MTPDILCELHTRGQNGGKIWRKSLRGRDVRAFAIQGFHLGRTVPSAIELRCQNTTGLTSVFVRDVTLSALHVETIALQAP